MARKKEMSHISTAYLDRVFDNPSSVRRQVVLKLKSIELRYPQFRFDAIAFCGMSGAMVAPMVAISMKKRMLMIRKTEINTHSEERVEGTKIASGSRYIILDDIVSSGATFERIVQTLHNEDSSLTCVGGFEYDKMYGLHLKVEDMSRDHYTTVKFDSGFLRIPKLQHLDTLSPVKKILRPRKRAA